MKNLGELDLTEDESRDLLNNDYVVIRRGKEQYVVMYAQDEDSYYVGELVAFDKINIKG